jgi:arylformamidase
LKPALWIDVTRPIYPNMPIWPGDPEFQVSRLHEIGHSSPCNVSSFSGCVHTGTHLDAPLHYVEDGLSVHEVPMEVMVGACRVIEIEDIHSIYPDELEKWHIQKGERILFRTANQHIQWAKPFERNFVAVSPEAARFLAQREVRLVGIDYLSIGAVGDEGIETHKILLSAGIWVIEGLDLRDIVPGPYEMVCAPMKIVDCEGAPARVLLKPLVGVRPD